MARIPKKSNKRKTNYIGEIMKLLDLKKGDIFKFGDKPWDFCHRLHSVRENPSGGYFIYFIGVNYQGDIENAKFNSFTSRDSNIDIFIPEYYLSEYTKTKGNPCIPHKDQRILMANNLNDINNSGVFCHGKDYHYDFFKIK